MNHRRAFFKNLLSAGTAASMASRAATITKETSKPFIPVQTPDTPDLNYEMDNGVKVFHLIAEPVKREIAPGRTLDLWGFNGTSPGPTIQIQQGDRVRVVFENRLPEPTSMHWHGFEVPNAMDGSPDVTQRPVNPGERYIYEWTLNQNGTFFYHSHMSMQQMMGMLGAFIMHPTKPYEPRVDKDYVFMLQEYAVLANNTVPDSMKMEFNWLTFNGKSGPASTPLIVRVGDRVRIRWINLGMDHHPIHLHGHTFHVTGTEGGRLAKEQWMPGNTLLVGVAQARDFEFTANNPGDWMLHCHMPHHTMNQMTSNVGPMSRHRMPGDDKRIAANANSVPGFPQDAYMEGPMMDMDKMVQMPQTQGLLPGWSAEMQGMMTLVRVFEPAKYDEMMARVRKGVMPGMNHESMPEMDHKSMPGMDHGSMPEMDHGSMPGMSHPL